jgi:hypothetical protein
MLAGARGDSHHHRVKGCCRREDKRHQRLSPRAPPPRVPPPPALQAPPPHAESPLEPQAQLGTKRAGRGGPTRGPVGAKRGPGLGTPSRDPGQVASLHLQIGIASRASLQVLSTYSSKNVDEGLRASIIAAFMSNILV